MKAAVSRTKRQYGATTAARYYVTSVKHERRCAACGFRLRPGADMVYRHCGPVTLCVSCAEGDPLVEYRPSVRWEVRRRDDVRKRAERANRKPRVGGVAMTDERPAD
jgi:hypothetical protein